MVRYMLQKADCEINALDKMKKSVVDYVMESSSTASAKLLLDYHARDAVGHDVFQRATLENNAHLVQYLLSCSSATTSDTDACGWTSGEGVILKTTELNL
jgi:hypothetical protein